MQVDFLKKFHLKSSRALTSNNDVDGSTPKLLYKYTRLDMKNPNETLYSSSI